MKFIKQIIAFIIKYRLSIFSGIWLFEALIFSNVILKETKELNVIVTTIIVLVFSVPVSFFWLEYNIPVLRIQGKSEPVECGKLVRKMGDSSDYYPYLAEKIIIENNGRTAATGCKGYVANNDDANEKKVRICWTIESERPNATINAKDNESLDFCAFKKDENGKNANGKIYFPTEMRWPPSRPPISGPDSIKCKVLVTSQNAEPVEANVIVHVNQMKIDIENKENDVKIIFENLKNRLKFLRRR